MSSRLIGIVAVVIGAIIAIVSLTADFTGLGDDESFDVGAQQAVGIAVGVVILILGIVLVRRSRRNSMRE